MGLKGVLFNILLFAFLSFGNVQAQENLKDNFPLRLGKYEYKVRLTNDGGKKRPVHIEKKDLGEWVAGYVDVEVKKQHKHYVIDLNARSTIPFILELKSYNQARFFPFQDKNLPYKSLECILETNYKILKFCKINEKNILQYSEPDKNREISLQINGKKFQVPYDTLDPLTLVVNLLTRDYPKSGNYYLGCIKGTKDKKPVPIHSFITKKGNNYTAELTFPKNTLLKNEAPFKIYYEKQHGKVKIPKLELYVDRLSIFHWAQAVPIK